MPGFVEKRETVWTAKEMSGRVLSEAYISEPTASWYGMSCIRANLAVVEGDWDEERCLKVGFHGGRNRLEVLEVVTMNDRVNIGALGEVDGAVFMVATDFDAEKPVELAKVSDFDMLRNFLFKV
jgi:hypothetical protein